MVKRMLLGLLVCSGVTSLISYLFTSHKSNIYMNKRMNEQTTNGRTNERNNKSMADRPNQRINKWEFAVTHPQWLFIQFPNRIRIHTYAAVFLVRRFMFILCFCYVFIEDCTSTSFYHNSIMSLLSLLKTAFLMRSTCL